MAILHDKSLTFLVDFVFSVKYSFNVGYLLVFLYGVVLLLLPK